MHKVAFDPIILSFSYNKTSKAKGANTPGGDDSSLDGTSLRRLYRLSKSLMNGTWKPGPARRTMIPKKGKGDRPLDMISPADKPVYNSIQLVLDIIYENDATPLLKEGSGEFKHGFLTSSHGFRRGRGVHSALNTTLT